MYSNFKPPEILFILGPSAIKASNIQIKKRLVMDIAKSLFGNRTHEGYAGKENYNVSIHINN
jgi:hypothetical protein